ncbi:aminodeoxychorismate synthase component I [Aureimonas fodinaquatilis]|uniref:aminodeoxychorismate synthase n=1 Tax=Aureimonas fodinaquatilis TaxID=2565783 RepID=A0A5B0E1X8_9HYPH|nr:aminodeoxychorismate synthase component I [Aureimonas fodinaquatilis]KAA0971740.1 aminodeoxychorismate synthase component I [Aureimonas fodinaquatilis]
MWIRSLEFADPFEAARRLQPLGGVAFLDSALGDSKQSLYSFVAAAPFAEFEARPGEGDLNALRALLARYRIAPEPDMPPFIGGAIGYFAYDFGQTLERLDRPQDWHNAARLAYLALYDTVLAINLHSNKCFLISTGFSETLDNSSPLRDRKAQAEKRLELFETALARAPRALAENPLVTSFKSDFTPQTYAASIERVQNYIRAGDIYQANIAQCFEADLPSDFDAMAFYARLRQTNPAPFAAYLETPGQIIASSSPERFIRLQGRNVETRPIKGTARREKDPVRDAQTAAALQASVKDRAENIMIVDLLRNDLSRVCTPESVNVSVLCGLETYASVHHLVSAVTGELRTGYDALDLVAATFPGGSITGAPKIRAMDIITEIENRLRGVYCGAIGYIGFDGAMDLNIAIRTVSIAQNRASFSAGGGITILSDAAGEYDESFAKAARLLQAFAGADT